MLFYSPLKDELLILFNGLGKLYFQTADSKLHLYIDALLEFGPLTLIGEL